MTAHGLHPVDRMLNLRSSPPPDDAEDALELFRDVYTDPYVVNGFEVAVVTIDNRVRLLHAALDGLQHEVVDRIDAQGRTVLVMIQRGRHTGILPSPLGELLPTERTLDRPFIEVISHSGDKLQGVWICADDLGRLIQADAVRLVQPNSG